MKIQNKILLNGKYPVIIVYNIYYYLSPICIFSKEKNWGILNLHFYNNWNGVNKSNINIKSCMTLCTIPARVWTLLCIFYSYSIRLTVH